MFKVYPDIDFSNIPKNLSWKNLAVSIATCGIRSIPVYYTDWQWPKSKYAGLLWIMYTDYVKDIIDRIIQLLSKVNFNSEKFDMSFYAEFKDESWRMLTLYFPLRVSIREYLQNKSDIDKLVYEDIYPSTKYVPASNIWESAESVTVSPEIQFKSAIIHTLN